MDCQTSAFDNRLGKAGRTGTAVSPEQHGASLPAPAGGFWVVVCTRTGAEEVDPGLRLGGAGMGVGREHEVCAGCSARLNWGPI